MTKAANLSVSYLHTSGYDQFDTDNINSPVLPGTLIPTSVANMGVYRNGVTENIYQYQSQGIFRQNQLIANVTVRAGAKVTLNGYYTLNYASGDTSGIGSFPSNPYNLMEDYGRTPFDVRHRAFISGTVVLPWDLRLSPFMVLQSGTPYNLTLAHDLIDSSINRNQRPAFAASCSLGAPVVSTPFGCFNTDPVNSPQDGTTLVPAYFLTSTAHFALNLRLSKSFGFGKVPEAAGARAPRGGGGGGGGGPRGGGGIGRGPGGPGGFGGGPGWAAVEREPSRNATTSRSAPTRGTSSIT